MSDKEMTSPEELNDTQTDLPAPAGEATNHRRKLLRASLAAAPVLASLKASSVLAGDHSCIRPSSFASLQPTNFQVSKARTVKDDYACYSHGYWKNNCGPLTQNYKSSTKFILSGTGFTANPGDAYKNSSKYLSLQDVLELTGNSNNAALARHVVAAFLSAVAFGDEQAMLTKAQCVSIWNGQGVWSPFAGTTWTLDSTMAYFEKVYGSAFL